MTSRRSVLRGAAGAMLALPFLPSLARADDRPPTRLVFFYVPNGIQKDWWTPDREGPDYDLKAITAPLQPVRDQVTLFGGLENRNAEDEVPGDHARGTASFLSCVPVRRTAGADVSAGVSADQVAARTLGRDTLFASLQLGVAPGGNTGDCTAGYACAYTRNISWAAPDRPLPNQTDPRLLFERLFGAGPGVDADTARIRSIARASVLDAVLADATALRARLGGEDRDKLGQYLQSVREVEQRAGALGAACDAPEPPPAGLSFPDHVAVTNELLALALACDLTRVATFMLGEAASNQTYDFVGVPGAHHAISHHQGDPKNLADLVTIGRWEVERFVDLVQRLQAFPEGDGTLLDASLLLFSSEISDGDLHDHRDLPVLLAGRGNGVHAPGTYRDEGGRPFADLLLAMLQGVGAPVTTFGADGTDPVWLG
ncbi:MAG: DUF1552 domain-containing protein [Alphaproteobacteria bacterium]|nr:DUF1552 domain-containing protein [Alphaproteobacteria bacterium]MCB9698046.1 DUF1552 domain-containing protein [Alphaproteobacteria bacterium]